MMRRASQAGHSRQLLRRRSSVTVIRLEGPGLLTLQEVREEHPGTTSTVVSVPLCPDNIQRALEDIEAETLMTPQDAECVAQWEQDLDSRMKAMELALHTNSLWRSDIKRKREALVSRLKKLEERKKARAAKMATRKQTDSSAKENVTTKQSQVSSHQPMPKVH